MTRFNISISGIHGSGKTTLWKSLRERFDRPEIVFIPERLKNPIWSYGSRKTAFRQQMDVIKTFVERDKMVGDIDYNHVVVRDRTPLSFVAYSIALGLKGKDLRLIKEFYKVITSGESRDNIIMYLYVPTDVLLDRINKRDRNKWNENDVEYIRSLQSAYNSVFNEYNVRRYLLNGRMSVKDLTDICASIINDFSIRVCE